ncbi:hypothetical protein A1O3_09744 [Capronia epimyces CBS 606.96]|uniref:Uncharacterized protein n=1 Tax=Capronia epimyces CBS 606.96 TaxID=1182542 RepID=W9XAL8_9EURO|nr:uncharacterized protein A1O3_09744 [Capronia epimyces CBS 606.96]EXJ77517.1 hypothetical protein A1O3_09744 [Capronia epimyces CBS 606.96]
MSFTLFHTRKDGTVKPIKMSIFDAFRGVPDPKPRKPKPCSCCGKIHPPKHAPEVTPETTAEAAPDATAETKADPAQEGTDAKAPKGEKKDDNDKDKDKEADDQIMLRMKAENAAAQWKDILAATSYTDEGELKGRWRQIKNQLADFKKEMAGKEDGKKEEEEKAEEKDKDKDGNTSNEEKAKLAEREAKAEKNRQEGLKRQQAAKEKKEAADQAEKNKDDAPQPKTRGETGELKMWAESYDKKKWRLMASKHYDRTGQRISPEQARKMAEAK